MDDSIRNYMIENAKKGGQARAKKLTAARRKEISAVAVKARIAANKARKEARQNKA